MAATVVIGCAEQSVAYELRAQLAEVVEVEVLAVAETTSELVAVVTAREPELVIVHDQLGPEPVHQVVRDLSIRRPASVTVVVTSDADPESLAGAMDAGARGVLTYPLSFTEVQQRVTSALEWARHMQGFVQSTTEGTGNRGRATVLALTGTKGGVGVTTVATHLAWDVRREMPSLRVLVVDLDLEKGDVTSFLEARHRSSVADLAKVADDLSVRTVADAVYQHDSGLHLLLPPVDVREVSYVTPQAVRQVVALLRQQYDLVILDVGARVTPVQAAAVEIADEVVAVLTPDMVSVRALRRNLTTWDGLQVRRPEHVHVLLNRSSRVDEIQPDVARRLSPAPVLETVVPDMGRKLETSMNSRSPEYVSDAVWWRQLRAFGREVGLVRAAGDGHTAPAAAGGGAAPATSRRSLRRGESGSVSVELLGVLPAVLLVCIAVWQLGWGAVTHVYAGYGAEAAARAVAIGQAPHEVRAATLDRFPPGMRSGVTVQVGTPYASTVRVSAKVPVIAPAVMLSDWTVDVQREVVREP